MNTNQRIQILAERVAAGASEFEDDLALALMPTVTAVVRSYVIPGNDRDENLSVALVAATEAIRTYDPERGPAVHFVRMVVANALTKEKTKRINSRAGVDTDQVEESKAPPVKEPFDPDSVRMVWPFLSHAEKRGVYAVVSDTDYAVVGEREGVTKQAVEKAWRSAKRLIMECEAGNRHVLDGLKVQPYSHFDVHIAPLLESLG